MKRKRARFTFGRCRGPAFGLLDTLTEHDRISIVTFSKDATVLGGAGMESLPATPPNIRQLKRLIRAVELGTTTSFTPAFSAAFGVLQRAARN